MAPSPFPKNNYILYDAKGNLAGLAKKAVEWDADKSVMSAFISKLSIGATLSHEDVTGALAVVRSMLSRAENQQFSKALGGT